ncbi:Uncharacterized conserved protein, DUF885 familyt [Salinimicrobium catena]|uniref:Uncharacterized conserved protein, DUF885 familyt n=1 Tax=Salinimicrobium catena TaxID=390640 RepID=A0A1H5LE10_9FLAO|nr:DUF885 domain-containing protein [Salinimicrobium catena]SDL08322.1 Uncharacterized conserved protein, DUF885 familyt [Salinimicrobium catena]SEE74601.1 Uncharacterized conserved protein, DUF885 familyt [Salinimicrobium catena]
MNLRTSIYPVLLVLFLSLAGCKKEKETDISAADTRQESRKLNEYFEKEFQKDLNESPMLQTRLGIKKDYGSWDDFSHLKYAEDLKKAKKRLAYLKDSINQAALDEDAALSYRLYKQQLENEIEDYRFRFYDYPVNQMHGIHAELPAFLINMHKIESESDAKDYISRLNKIPKVMKDVEKGLELREMNQIMPPSFVFAHTIEASKNLISGKPFEKSSEPSTLLADFKEKVEKLDLSAEKKSALILEAQTALTDSVKPAYEGLIATLEDQSQRATQDHGVWKFPKGKEFYSTALKRMTTTDLAAEEIHEIGLQEVARIHKEMEEIKEKVGFEGSLQDFFKFMREDEQFYYPNTPEGKERYLTEAKDIINTMKGRLDSLFLTKPEADIVVKAVEPFREKSAGKAFYQQPALDGSRPGTYYANLYDMKAMPTYQMEALAYHEGIPGHHMQLAIAQELDSLPMFRKLKIYTAYVEGWGLYSEKVPKEIGFYEDPYSDFGRLAMELWRSIRLVVDTGIHTKKWTREEAIEYYKTNSPNAESDAVKMVERHIVMPGQATAYKIGMNKILELREKAKKELGSDFDIREFHDVVLTNGALPLNVLEDLVNDWIAEKMA